MRDETRRVEIVKISGTGSAKESDLVVRESPVEVFLNDEHIVTLMCTPKDIEPLAVGFLFSEGLIKGKKDIKRLHGNAKDRAVWVETTRRNKTTRDGPGRRFITTGCGKGLSFVDAAQYRRKGPRRTDQKILPGTVSALMKEFQGRSEVYKRTGGVHSAALANERGIVAFSEDIGRHNAVDKVIGESVLEEMKTDDLVLVTSGRVSSDILVKAARCRISLIVSRAAPTDLSVKLARDLGITLIGFVRGSRMNIYSNEWRVVAGSLES